MATKTDQLEQFHAKTRAEWRSWLEANHATSPGVWLVSFKASVDKPRVPYPEVVEEALCFGWIDSLPRALDAQRGMLLFTPRKRGSPWSALNKRRIERLIAEGRMAPAGLARIETAKRDGSWTSYDAVEALTVPGDLTAALATDGVADANFRAFSATTKKQLLWWVESAKRPETRAKRITAIVAGAAEDRNPIAYTRKTAS